MNLSWGLFFSCVLRGSIRAGYYHFVLVSVDWAAGLDSSHGNLSHNYIYPFFFLSKKDRELKNSVFYSLCWPWFPLPPAPLLSKKLRCLAGVSGGRGVVMRTDAHKRKCEQSTCKSKALSSLSCRKPPPCPSPKIWISQHAIARKIANHLLYSLRSLFLTKKFAFTS